MIIDYIPLLFVNKRSSNTILPLGILLLLKEVYHVFDDKHI